MHDFVSTIGPFLPLLSIAGSIGIIGTAVALGIRHGIDWDHIAAITDITSTAAGQQTYEEEDRERWLTGELGIALTDESHHSLVHAEEAQAVAAGSGTLALAAVGAGHQHTHARNGNSNGVSSGRVMPAPATIAERQKAPMLLATMYALGHGSVVFVLGLFAIVAKQFLPSWIDPIMERVVGVTLLVLAAYLFFSVYQYFRAGEEFRIRSRWMVVFAGVRNGWQALRSRVFGAPREHTHVADQYGVKTAYGIGMIHGIGAETGTQVLIITTAVGAGSKLTGVVALTAFIVGILISNTAVALMATVGFVSARQRQSIYVAAGLFAAVFSLFVGTYFILQSADALPALDKYFQWIGGGRT